MEKSNLQQTGNQLFSGYISDPSKTGSTDAEQVKNLLDKFPYCQILHSVYSHCLSNKKDQFISQLEKTSLYSPDRELLFKIIHQPQELFNSKDQTVDAVADEVNGSNNQILSSGDDEDPKNQEKDENTVDPDIDTNQLSEQSASIIPEDTLTNLQPENADSDNTEPAVVPDTLGNEIVSEPENNKADDFIDDEEPANTQPHTETESIENVNPENSTPTEPDLDEIKESQAQPGSTEHEKIETVTPDNDNLVAEPQKEAKSPDQKQDGPPETDTIETIVPENDNIAAGPQVEDQELYANPAASVEEDKKNADTAEEDETGQLILADIIATDFFAFEESLENNQTDNGLAEDYTKVESPYTVPDKLQADEPSNIVRYDDDKLPYTFLWWLDKTRKKHAGTYQPYLNLKAATGHELKKNSVADLNNQIIQNIFSLQPPFQETETSEQKPPHTSMSKEEVIIQKFIEEEPQIKPPHPEKADNENKARKSSEDTNDLVSETLAMIYADQMLFHKAIDTYKKLSLKFPEKSPYFADQIKELGKKINREP